ncbi:MAG TPA: hypothetical protein VLB02_02070, partial [Candidatus Paceibacterota bacterium]|nr:hypothetical protein [Candidatus Paceibacterota bacterium]
MQPTEKFETPKQEIDWIGKTAQERIIQQAQDERAPNGTDATKKTIEAYAKAEAKEFLHETAILPTHETEHLVLKLKPEEHDIKIEELFKVALEKGIKNALDVAAKFGDPHVEDDFHRFLVQYLHTIGAIPGLKEKSTLHGELDHSLFTVTLPSMQGESEKQNFKTFIQAMKQFYQSMLALEKGAHYSLELAVQNHGRDIALYASVPRHGIDIFEKTVHAYYPGASVEPAADDYNIFTVGGAIAGAYAQLAEPAIFPLNTDAAFEHDPLAALIGSLSRLETAGEGAAIQIIIAADESKMNKVFESVITSAQKQPGEKVKDLYKEATGSILAGTGKALFSLFSDGKKDEEKKEKPVDTHGIELATAKNKSQTINAAVRVIASAQTPDRAASIITTVKSSFNQFSLVGSNSIEWKDIKTSHLFGFCQAFSFRSRNPDEELLLSIDELAT